MLCILLLIVYLFAVWLVVGLYLLLVLCLLFVCDLFAFCYVLSLGLLVFALTFVVVFGDRFVCRIPGYLFAIGFEVFWFAVIVFGYFDLLFRLCLFVEVCLVSSVCLLC